jgi:hypothetical protein
MTDGAKVRKLPDRRPALIVVVAARVLEDLDALVERMGKGYRDEVPEYASMTAAQMADEVLPVSRRIVGAFFAAVVDRTTPDASQLFEVREMGRRRLEMGIPLEPILHVYRIAGRIVWDAIVQATEPGEEVVLAEVGALWMDYIDRAASIAAASYLAASHQRLRQVDARRRALLEALLSATTPAEVAAVSVQFSTVLAPTYAPVLIDGERAPGGIDTLLGTAPKGTIGGFRGGRVLLLVPAPTVDVHALARVAGHALVTYAPPAAPGPDLLRELGHAEALLSAAQSTGATSGVYGPDDLVVAQLLASNERIAATLRRRVHEALAGRDHDGLITSTLRTYLDTGSIPETARREVVHANTVLYRLKRVRVLTGLDPRVPAEAALLVLGLS